MQTSLSQSETRPFLARLNKNRVLIIAVAAIAIWIAVLYGHNLGKRYFTGDDLKIIAFVQEYGPLGGLLGNLGAGETHYADRFFRPFFIVQAWVLFRLFGMNPVGYHVVGLLLHIVATVLLFLIIYQLTQGVKLALVASLFFAAHPYVSPLVLWATDSATLSTIFVNLIIFLLLRPENRPRWYTALFTLLVLAPLTRENGLAAIAAVIGYTLLAALTARFTWRQTVTILLGCLLVTAAYFALRGWAVGIVPDKPAINDTSIMWTHYSVHQVVALTLRQRITLYAYTVLANFVSSFFQVFLHQGMIWNDAVAATLALTTLILLAMFAAPKGASWERRAQILALAAMFVVVAAGLTALYLFRIGTTLLLDHLRYALQLLQFAIPGALSILCIGYAARHWPDWSPQQKALAALALALILANSLISFPYFRFRNLRYGALGWLLLFALTLTHLTSTPQLKRARSAMIALLALATLLNGILTYLGLRI